ncbi:hypothetical protein D8M04_11425 [Oceanobacillus piezotolerans]|uniref:DoxX family membrane protein n=1 Tax=Oceanobacillus piezotolerans TaxID=2448030 RepID=A0A498DCI2_9BACI|nr:hypothetical protein [Oceanobacillus piezotolerans]RLL45453.1 hypothetical protein D8M04_11425 [Oceanobacillus piezotolerans]
MKKGWMHASRIFLGIVFFVAGINGYFVYFGLDPFIATSPEAMALFIFDYLLLAEKSLEVIGGVLLLWNLFIPLTLAVLAPIIVNILLLHVFVDHSLLLLAVLMTTAYSYLIYGYFHYYKGLFVKKAKWKE